MKPPTPTKKTGIPPRVTLCCAAYKCTRFVSDVTVVRSNNEAWSEDFGLCGISLPPGWQFDTDPDGAFLYFYCPEHAGEYIENS